MLTTLRPQTAPPALMRITSPIGRIELIADDDAVLSLSIDRDGRLPHDDYPDDPNPLLERAAVQLGEYFSGSRTEFDLPVRFAGTEFQRQIWHELEHLAFGEVVSYGELGRATGRATAGRAVGGAVGANPVPIIVPCHRVLASNNRITGYSSGNGIPTKLWLLTHEGIPAIV